MSTDPSIAAFARPDAAGDESQLLAAAQALDVAELMAALGQVEALLADAPEGSEGSAAIERIADIAFVLHEREVERSLCDALDGAVRDIGAADAVKRASLQRVREAAALLRELRGALNEILATAAVEQQPQPAAIGVEAPPSPHGVQTVRDSRDAEAGEEDELAAPAGLFDADMPPDDAFAVTVAALADALPEEAGTAPAHSQPEIPEPFAASETLAHSESEDGADEETPADAATPVAVHGEARAHGEAPGEDEQSTVFSEVAPEPKASRPAIDPNEDPDELFEPVAAPPPSIAPAPAAIAMPSSAGEAAHASILLAASPAAPAVSAVAAAETLPASASALRLPAAAPVHETSPPPPSDPLAPIRALSEEELIALFS
jgi:hypothetical protein